MPHGGREAPPSPRSSKLSKGKGRVFKNSRLQPTEIRALQAVARQYNATATPSSTPTGSTVGAGEEFSPAPFDTRHPGVTLTAATHNPPRLMPSRRNQ
ncbi:unnamed protein product [Spodoptera littoralis]|uniref:Uncharacterized protein n=1 Tax=Spodoptera littoralis TaxID=7109 RepID=A0A9P0I5Z1_SPOLI|nr:unnamed protein product [Spodoptera littoralis]CAH1642066.1 unnamed protein product [Spodoptera littoralis]